MNARNKKSECQPERFTESDGVFHRGPAILVGRLLASLCQTWAALVQLLSKDVSDQNPNTTGRLPDEFVADVLANTDIVGLIGEKVELKRAGKEYKALSPFTNERSPSFYVNPAKGMYFCFSSGKNGNAITFLTEYSKLSFRDAVEELARRLGMSIPTAAAPYAGRSQRLKMDEAVTNSVRFYRASLKHTPEAIAYLKALGISGETAAKFSVGFAPSPGQRGPGAPVADLAMATKDLATGAPARGASEGLVFPIRDVSGKIAAFAFHSLTRPHLEHIAGQKSLMDPDAAVAGLNPEPRPPGTPLPSRVILVPTCLHVLALRQTIDETFVAVPSGIPTVQQWSSIYLGAHHVVTLLPDDPQGRITGVKIALAALPQMRDQRVLRFLFTPRAEGIVGHARNLGPDAFIDRLDSAVGAGKLLCQALRDPATNKELDPQTLLKRIPEGLTRREFERTCGLELTDEMSRPG